MEGSVAKMEESPEESSWTFYIQGFICDNNDDDNNSLSSEHESPSLVSDAASSPVKKLANNYSRENEGVKIGFSSANHTNLFKQNSFKKQKTKTMHAITDYDLEDTASSPVNSPKGSYINQFMKNQREKAKMDISEVKRNNIGKGGVFGVERDGRNYTDLKEKTTWG